jgi:hypothetical protein
MGPGVIDVRISLSVAGKLVRKGALAITTREIASAPPFETFLIGLELDGKGGLLKITRDLSRNTPEFYYYLGPLRLEPASTLSILWYINGVPFGPEMVPASSGWDAILNIVPGNNGLEPGEYQVLISLDSQPVYAAVVVVR